MNAPVESTLASVATPNTMTSALVLDGQAFQQIMEVAKVMSGGIATVPKHLQKNPADCMAVIMQSMQWKMNPFAVAQKTHVVNGTLGYEAQLVNAVITALAPTKDRLHFEWFGDWSKVIGKFREGESKSKVDEDTGEKKKYRVPNWTMQDEQGLGVRVWATLKGETEPRVLELLLIQARTRNSTLWADDPKQQLAYLATKRWSRLYCPDVILGVYTPDELDEAPVMRDITPPPAAAAPQELPPYPDAQLDASSEQWRERIAAKKTSPDHLINTISSKYTLSDEQKDKIRALAPIEGEATDASA
jgi:hypothetical protein